MTNTNLVACHDCDLVQREVALPLRGRALCARCGALLYRDSPESLERTLAYLVGAACFFVLANAFPLAVLAAQGSRTSTTLFGTVAALHAGGVTSVAALVFVTTILMPAVELAAMLYVLVPLKLGWVPRGLPAMLRLVQAVKPWGMVEVFMLGMLVSLAKLAHIAAVLPGVAVWSLGAQMILLAAAAASFDSRTLWVRVREAQR